MLFAFEDARSDFLDSCETRQTMNGDIQVRLSH